MNAKPSIPKLPTSGNSIWKKPPPGFCGTVGGAATVMRSRGGGAGKIRAGL
jgi:hypothetical protein